MKKCNTVEHSKGKVRYNDANSTAQGEKINSNNRKTKRRVRQHMLSSLSESRGIRVSQKILNKENQEKQKGKVPNFLLKMM